MPKRLSPGTPMILAVVAVSLSVVNSGEADIGS